VSEHICLVVGGNDFYRQTKEMTIHKDEVAYSKQENSKSNEIVSKQEELRQPLIPSEVSLQNLKSTHDADIFSPKSPPIASARRESQCEYN
jgi:hypothetical protein